MLDDFNIWKEMFFCLSAQKKDKDWSYGSIQCGGKLKQTEISHLQLEKKVTDYQNNPMYR